MTTPPLTIFSFNVTLPVTVLVEGPQPCSAKGINSPIGASHRKKQTRPWAIMLWLPRESHDDRFELHSTKWIRLPITAENFPAGRGHRGPISVGVDAVGYKPDAAIRHTHDNA